MSYGKVYETSFWGILPVYIFLGFNKTLAFISQTAQFFISTINITIDTILETIDRTNYD
tara:strand:+ start:370 stop:546 length:177 start_codon:yes stop_codon:yes gene_type:complete